MKIEQIETVRLIIRNFTPDDADDLHEILGDAETMKYCESPYAFEKTKTFLETFCIGRYGALAAVHRQSQKVIGYVLFNEIDPSVYEMGWFFNRGYWQQGYAYETCKAVIDHAFRELDAHRIFAETVDGVKSVGLMQKLGMKLEGVQRSQTKDNDGNWADLYFYGLLKEKRDDEMLEVNFYHDVEDELLKFAVIISKTDGKWVFCKHKARDTYEVPGGHREPGETILETARRELMEETGAVDFALTPICVYSVKGKTRVSAEAEETFGMLYYAEIRTFEALHSEIERIMLTDSLDIEWTYPLIQPKLIEEAARRGFFK